MSSKRTSSVILEAGSRFAVETLPNGRVKITLHDVDEAPIDAAPDTVYNITGVSRRLGVSPRSIENYVRLKRDPLPYSVSMGSRAFLEKDIMQWLEQGKSLSAKRVLAKLGHV